ncbi:MAG: glycoside hydrolase family 3 N-terminal domain-containing protein [Candidatus Merdivicinus sp.]|jgi:beta-glucosidase
MAKKASEHVRYYQNPNGPTIGTVSRKVIEKDGLYFKDLDGSGEFKAFDDWRLPAMERAQALVKVLTEEEKLGQIFISDWRTGLKQEDPAKKDESGLLDEGEFNGKTIFGEQHLPGTSTLLKDWWARHIILRENPKPDELADWIDQLHATAEECEHFVPVQVVSNSRNENGELVYGMNDASGVFAAWPGTLGIAAAVRGDSMEIIDRFADCVRREWDAVGMKKGYMYMADVMSDPRWQRTYGTFGEDPELITEIFRHLVPGIQGSAEGVTTDGVAMTVKHFPGGGPRENGFDPHYAMGQWNVYKTPGSLQKYHVPSFQAAVDCHTSAIMPYYSKPSKEKSSPQTDCKGNPVEMRPYGFAYNKPFIDGMLRGQMGFEGYINSDTGIVHNMKWGVEMLDVPERIGFAVNHVGVDLISGLFDMEEGREAMTRAVNGYYDTHPIPEGFTKEELVLTREALDRAVTRTLREMFELGMFENPYRDPKNAVEVVTNTRSDWEEAMEVHRKSVVLLKNDGILPLTANKLNGKLVYAECFSKKLETAQKATEALRAGLGAEVTLTDDPAKADYAILMLSPSSGEYFSATPGYLELDLCEGKIVPNVDQQGRPTAETHAETTLSGMAKIREIAETIHRNGGKVLMNINVTLAWQVGNVEPLADALTVGFDTYPSATLDVMLGRFAPVGRLPITLPRGDEVLKVNADGVCVSPNDVPGYDKDLYMPDSLKDENGKAYAYRDAVGNYYELDFGLTY